MNINDMSWQGRNTIALQHYRVVQSIEVSLRPCVPAILASRASLGTACGHHVQRSICFTASCWWPDVHLSSTRQATDLLLQSSRYGWQELALSRYSLQNFDIKIWVFIQSLQLAHWHCACICGVACCSTEANKSLVHGIISLGSTSCGSLPELT